MVSIMVDIPEHLLADLDQYVDEKPATSRDTVIWKALRLLFTVEAIPNDVYCPHCGNTRAIEDKVSCKHCDHKFTAIVV